MYSCKYFECVCRTKSQCKYYRNWDISFLKHTLCVLKRALKCFFKFRARSIPSNWGNASFFSHSVWSVGIFHITSTWGMTHKVTKIDYLMNTRLQCIAFVYLSTFAWKIHFAHTSSLKAKPAIRKWNARFYYVLLLFYASTLYRYTIHHYIKNLKFPQHIQLSRVLLHNFFLRGWMSEDDERKWQRKRKHRPLFCYSMFLYVLLACIGYS